MKKIFIIIVLILSLEVLPQESLSPSVELFFGTEQASGGGITFTLSNQGQVWGVIYPPPVNCDDWVYYTTNDFDNPSYTVTLHNQPTGSWAGLDFTSIQDNGGYYDVYGYGLYKITTSESDSYFYIDYRDQRLGCFPYGTIGNALDVWIKYNASTNTFFYYNGGGEPFYSISNGSLLKLWELKNAGTPQTSLFPNYWQNCLVVIPKTVSNVPRPHLVWGPIPDFLPTGYRIYWAKTLGGQPQNFGLLTVVDANTTEYTHTSEEVGNQYTAFYRVQAFNNTSQSDFTNTAQIGICTATQKTTHPNVLEQMFNAQTGTARIENFPNPFNPTTIIKYHLPEDLHVKLIIYDVLGCEVTTLVNEVKKIGSYEVEFDATKLTSGYASGVYFYQISAGNFVSAKKMLLVR